MGGPPNTINVKNRGSNTVNVKNRGQIQYVNMGILREFPSLDQPENSFFLGENGQLLKRKLGQFFWITITIKWFVSGSNNVFFYKILDFTKFVVTFFKK